jgi:glutaconate CoA-transferase subunit B
MSGQGDRPVGYSASEMMIAAAARGLAGKRVCFVGVGLPNIAVNLARLTVASELVLVYEAGVFGARPARLPLSIGDPTIVTGATAAMSMFELFAFYLQGGLVDVGFLGGAQIDRYGNLNTTVIGPYDAPSVRLPGSGGACEIALNAREVLVIMRQSRRSFVERPDFRTSAGHVRETDGDATPFWRGSGPTLVVTDLAVFGFASNGEMELRSLHPGVTEEQLAASMAWEPRRAERVVVTEPPTSEELRLIREELDRGRIYTR